MQRVRFVRWSTVARLTALFSFAVLITAPLFGQTAGRITGVVKDQSGAAVAGASVSATNEATSEKRVFTTGSEGGFVIPALQAGSYTVEVTAGGFKAAVYKNVQVDPAKEHSLTISLKIGGAIETVEVIAGQELVNTTTNEVTNTISMAQVQNLPALDRNPLNLVRSQPGTPAVSNRTNTNINGGRPTWTAVTLDGINIQDNFIRTNDLDFLPNRPSIDTISEFTISTNNESADTAGGASQVKMVTPTGTNTLHGRVFEYNRNSAYAANSWFNNASNVPRPFLNQNNFGANLGGPILKNKLFFYGYYEGLRVRSAATLNQVVPAHDDYLTGAFRYVRPSDGTVQTVNVLSLNSPNRPALSVDPKVQSIILSKIPSASTVNNFDRGDSSATRLLNTAAFRQNQRNNTNRNIVGGRFDYKLNEKHKLGYTYSRTSDYIDRGDLDPVNVIPVITNDEAISLYSGSWLWTVSPNLINEFRAGADLAPALFNSSYQNPAGLFFDTASTPGGAQVEGRTATLAGLRVQTPLVTFQPQGRDTRTRQLNDNLSWVTGNHSFGFGGGLQQVRVRAYNARGQFPIPTTGFSPAAPANLQLVAGDFPGGSISATDLGNANGQRAFLGGVISQVQQTFQVLDQKSGFIAGLPNIRNYRLDNVNLYVKDTWRIKSNFTMSYGLKWEYYTPMQEDHNLALIPVGATDSAAVQAALLSPSTTLQFVNGDFYNKALNNFGPSIGFAWDPFKDGKTSIRGGYTMAFVNEETLRVAGNATVDGNPGLSANGLVNNQFTTVNAGVPVVPTPIFKVPRTFADQLVLSPTSAAQAMNPNIQTPFVHEIDFGIQREIGKDFAVEVRYVGTLGRDLWQGLDLNQNNAGHNAAYLADFGRARSNGFIALNTAASTPGCTATTCGVFNPAFNPNLPGSQQLTVIPTVGSNGLLTNSTVRNNIQTNQAAQLADFYVSNRSTFTAAPGLFLPNPGIYVSDFYDNGAYTDYHGLQAEVHRRMRNGLLFEANYTWSKVLTNSSGTAQTRLEPYLDNANRSLERSRAEFDLRHAVKGNFVYQLPVGRGHWLAGGANGFLDRVIGGWQVSSILGWQSGSPFSILSTRGTLNRAGRSTNQAALSSLSQEQIKNLLGVFKKGDGSVYYINPSVIDPATGRAVGPDNLANSASSSFNQVFFNPVAGQTGNIGRLAFDGPSLFQWDAGLGKKTRITERIVTDFRADFINVLNHPVFQTGDPGSFDWEVNSTNFGKMNTVALNARRIQLGLRVEF